MRMWPRSDCWRHKMADMLLRAPQGDARQFGRAPEPQRETGPERGAVVDVERHATNRVSARYETVVAACDKSIQPKDHAAMGMPGQLQRHTACGRLRGVPRLMIEQHDQGV